MLFLNRLYNAGGIQFVGKLSETCQCLSRLHRVDIEGNGWVSEFRFSDPSLNQPRAQLLHSQDSDDKPDTFIYFSFNTRWIRTISPLSDFLGSFQTLSQHWQKNICHGLYENSNEWWTRNEFTGLFLHNCHSQNTLKMFIPPTVIWEWFDIAIFYNMKNRVSGINIFI